MDAQIVKIILEALIGVIAIIITGYLIPWLKGVIGEDKYAMLVDFTAFAVRAAEQMYSPEEWQKKKEYVKNYVYMKAAEIGIDLSEIDIENLIEGLVNEIKKG